jgi:cell division septum initiation protein DivIVA
MALYNDDAATLDDLREAATMLEELERDARRVLGGAHPTVSTMEHQLRNARAALRAYEDTQP